MHRCVHEWGMDPKTGPSNREAMGGEQGTQRCTDILDVLDKRALTLIADHDKELRELAQHLLRTETLERRDLERILPRSLKNRFQTQIGILG